MVQKVKREQRKIDVSNLMANIVIVAMVLALIFTILFTYVKVFGALKLEATRQENEELLIKKVENSDVEEIEEIITLAEKAEYKILVGNIELTNLSNIREKYVVMGVNSVKDKLILKEK